MTGIGQESMIIGERSINEGDTRVPRQLTEANQLLGSINRRLEDCGLEWRSEISRKQWKLLNAKELGENVHEPSVLTRTYFIDKDLDQAFQHLLSCNQIFSDCLKNFIARLCGSDRDQSARLAKGTTCDAQNQCTETTENSVLSNNFARRSAQVRNRNDLVKQLLAAQSSFGDVIKAKEQFDDKFLGLKDALHNVASVQGAVRGSRALKNGIEGNKGIGRVVRRRRVRNARFLSRRNKQKPLHNEADDEITITSSN